MMECNEAKKIVEKIVETRLQAIDEKNLELYMSTVVANNLYYLAEQRRWFKDIISGEISDLTLSLLSVEVKDNGDIRADIHLICIMQPIKMRLYPFISLPAFM